jgi:hypothetical protein
MQLAQAKLGHLYTQDTPPGIGRNNRQSVGLWMGLPSGLNSKPKPTMQFHVYAASFVQTCSILLESLMFQPAAIFPH